MAAADLTHERRIEVVGLLVSPVHRYAGRPTNGPAHGPTGPHREHVGHLAIRAGLGIVGDRYFANPAHRRAAVTILAVESIERLSGGLSGDLDPFAARRNVIVRGLDVDALIGATITIDTGSGAVELAVRSPARPCAWMDRVLAPGAHRGLGGRGGVRCEALTDGVVALGPATVRADVELAAPAPTP